MHHPSTTHFDRKRNLPIELFLAGNNLPRNDAKLCKTMTGHAKNLSDYTIIYLMPNVAIDDPLRVQIKGEWSKPVIL